MTPEQEAAYIIAQAAVLSATVAGMQAENAYREMQGKTIAYGEDAFVDAINRSGVHHNAVMELFQDG